MKNLVFLMACVPALAVFAANVSDIKVQADDSFGGDTGAVASRCQTRIGAEYDPVSVTRDITTLTASGEFEEVSADANETESGVEIVFHVKRKVRFLQPLVVEGADYFSESRISKDSELKDGFLYGEADLASAAAKVRLAYLKKNFADATVTPEVKLISGNDAQITFVVREGLRRKIRDVVFSGADHIYDSSAINRNANPFYKVPEGCFEAYELHEAVSDYPWWNPVGWFTDSPVTEDQRAQCCEKVAAVYRNHGYLDCRVSGPTITPIEGSEKADLVFTVVEGPRYTIGESSIEGVTKYSVTDVFSQSNLPEIGAIAEQQVINEAAHRIKVAVGSGDLGLADTQVDVKYMPNFNDPTVVDIVYQVKEGVPVVIDEVKIRGNDYTMDKVIRREIKLGPGDRMLEDDAERSQKKLENLDYFARVRYYLESANKGKDADGNEYRNLVYEVEEKNTGSFMVGIGASSVDSVYVSAEVNQNNFDLFAPGKLFRGAGQKARLYGAFGPRYQSAELGIVEPWFLNRQLELSFDAYRRLRWYDQYDIIRSGAQISLAYPVKFWPTWQPFGRLGLGFSGEFIEFDDVENGAFYNGNNLVSFQDEEREHGDAFEPVVHLFWAKDSRDNFRIPTKGAKSRLFGDIAPFGDSTYWRVGFNHRHYWNVWKRYNHVFMAGVRLETIDAISDDVAIYNRMFLGGPRSIRGVRYRHVSPMVRSATSYSYYAPWGGQTLACANFEYTIPIVKMLRFAVFSDIGGVGEDAWDFGMGDTYAWTVGCGVRLDLPMFPIRLDFATPIKKPDEAEEEVFSFTVGYDF